MPTRVPYLRIKNLKNLPNPAAQTYIAHILEYLPLGVTSKTEL